LIAQDKVNEFLCEACSFHIHSVEYWIGAEKLEIVPEKYAVVTESEIGKYLALKRALKTSGQNFRVDPAEWKQVEKFLLLKGSDVIKVDDNYYQLHLSMPVA
jgi:hypothetical protein